jgi:thiamine biosynthesis protein ThiI
MQSTVYVSPVGHDALGVPSASCDGVPSADLDEVVERLGKVFGLGAIQKCGVFPKDFAVIASGGAAYLEKSLKFAKSFKVEAKRADKTFPMKTPDIQRELGGAILEAYPHLSVDVHNPEVTVLLEIRDKAAYLNAQRITAAGGLPVGSSGNALLMLSGGLDSPVAAYMIAKRGVRIDAVHFMSPPYTSERALLKVEDLCKALKDYLVTIRLHCIDFAAVQEAIRDNCPEEYSTVILRRMMIKAANLLCNSGRDSAFGGRPPRGEQSPPLGKRNTYGALITGESLGQVASQTLSAIGCTDAAADLPVLRPLIGMDKIEIVALARKIETFDISIQPFEDCCTIFTPKHPKTNPKMNEICGIEAKFNYDDLVTDSVNNMKIIDF